MPKLVRYLTHPEVQVDPTRPVPSWGLSAVGRARVAALIAAGWLRGTTLVVTSAERKAIETAEPIAQALSARLEIRAAMHENDRSTTGFLPPAEFERVADLFFADPEASVHGWETARAAQMRIVHEAGLALAAAADDSDVLFVGHGAVGTLLMCHHAGWPIGRNHDQRRGGGCYFTLGGRPLAIVHAWRPIEHPP